MRLWSQILRWLKRSPPAPGVADVLSTLTPEARAELMEQARFLYREGVWVRPLAPGEVPSETPEIDENPLKTNSVG